jgi:hypothetical protein
MLPSELRGRVLDCLKPAQSMLFERYRIGSGNRRPSLVQVTGQAFDGNRPTSHGNKSI